jgi:DUF4097 and DUF4098 domain-containing protein YvlB
MTACYGSAFVLAQGKSNDFKNLENVEKIYENQKNVNLNIVVLDAHVLIQQAQNNIVTINIKKIAPFCNLEITNNAGEIYVDYQKGDNWLENKRGCKAEIKISLPKNSSIATKIVSGRTEITGEYSSLDLKAVSGDLSFNGQSENLNIKSVSGEVKVQGFHKNLNAKSVSGDIDIKYSNILSGDILATDTVSGNVKIIIPKKTELNYSFKSVSGQFKLHEAFVSNNAKFTIKSKSVSGDVNVNSY